MTNATEKVSAPTRLLFHYIKSNFFRVAHVDGVIGGVTPRGFIHMSFFSERAAIPQTMEHTLLDTGTLGDVVNQAGKEGIVRELDIDLVMTLRVATDLRDWLTERIKELDRAQSRAAEISSPSEVKP